MTVLCEARAPDQCGVGMIVAALGFSNGAPVKKGATLIELEAAKAIFAIEAEHDGFVEYLRRESDAVLPGEVVARIHDLQPRIVVPAETVDDEPSEIQGVQVRVRPLGAVRARQLENLNDPALAAMTGSVFAVVDLDGVIETIAPVKRPFQNLLLPLVVYETARLLRKYPMLNACHTAYGMACYQSVHIGISVDVERGLKVCKIPDADTLSIGNIEKRILAGIKRYMSDRLTVDDVTGSTFIINDVSDSCAHFIVPIIPRHQGAILGLAAPDGDRNRAILSLTVDHRIVEGRAAGDFLNDLKARLQSYADLSVRRRLKVCSKCRKSLNEMKDGAECGLVRIVDPDCVEKLMCVGCLLGW